MIDTDGPSPINRTHSIKVVVIWWGGDVVNFAFSPTAMNTVTL